MFSTPNSRASNLITKYWLLWHLSSNPSQPQYTGRLPPQKGQEMFLMLPHSKGRVHPQSVHHHHSMMVKVMWGWWGKIELDDGHPCLEDFGENIRVRGNINNTV